MPSDSIQGTDPASDVIREEDEVLKEDEEQEAKTSSKDDPKEPHGANDAEHPSVLRSDDGENGEMYTAVRRAPEYKGWALLAMSFSAIGIVYGDIGTSPLYVLNGILPADGPVPSQEDVIGVVSLIFWLFTLVVIVKYGLFILSFGTLAGEGGTFALYQGLFPKPACDDDDNGDGGISRALSLYPTKSVNASPTPKSSRRERLLALPWVKPLLCSWALWGSGLTLSDGILTPAVSVLSAAEGIAVVKPNVDTMGVALGILIGLILAQPLGIHRLSFLYSPIVSLWLLFLLVTGIINVTSYPAIFRAIDPSRAILYFTRTGNYDAIAGALLAVTGTEALFANLGQFSRRALTMPLIAFAYPCLMFAYFGQGAKLIDDPTVIANVFYLSVPGGAGSAPYYIAVVLGILATIIASQAMLSGSYSIVCQLVHMHCLPSIKQTFPSSKNPGQVFQHTTNVLLGAAVIAAVAGFQHSAKLTSAYGFAVSTVFLTSTCLVALQIYFVKQKPAVAAISFLIVFAFIDALIWGAAVKKVPEGAWFSLAIGTTLAIFMIWWTWCSSLVDEFDRRNRLPLSSLIKATDVESQTLELHSLSGNVVALPRMQSTLTVFWKPAGGRGVPHAFSAFLSKLPSLPTLTVFLSLRVLAVPKVSPEEQLLVDRNRAQPGFFGATLRLGYKDTLDMRGTEERLVNAIVKLEKEALGWRAEQGDVAHEVEQRVRQAAVSRTHVWPSYYLSPVRSSYSLTKFSFTWTDFRKLGQPHVLAHTFGDGLRNLLVVSLFRRLKGAFAGEEEGPFDPSEEVIRISIRAQV